MKYTLTLICLLAGNLLFAQMQRFTTTGSIQFEKKSNMYALIEKLVDKDNESYFLTLIEQYKKTQPQFKTLKSTLTFGQNKTLYTPEEVDMVANNFFNLALSGQPNTIFTDLTSKTAVAQKVVFEEKFLLKDTVRKINWKLTSETREIAGYPCRRANALILDSIYVVAFYTDQIPVSGGPESFTGLPGMILGVALPHENLTWFATKVTDVNIPGNELVPPKKGKPVDKKQLRATLDKAMKDWGNQAQQSLKAFTL